MNLIVAPGNRLKGSVNLPGDKSLSHRAALFSALAEGESIIENFLLAGVTQPMLNGLTGLGVDWSLRNTTLTVNGRGLTGLNAPEGSLYCGNSATTLRLLAGAVAAAGVSATLDGSPGLRSRPMGRIIEPLSRMGVSIESNSQNSAPLKLASRPPGQPLHSIRYAMPVASAQVKSCILLAALAADGPTTLSEPVHSRDHTERMLKSMGVSIKTGDNLLSGDANQASSNSEFIVELYPPQPFVLSPLQLTLPGDISSAAFLIVAALITPGSEIMIKGVGLNPTRTGLLDALLEMSADIQVAHPTLQGGEPSGDLIIHTSELKGIQVGGPLVVRMIDEFPAFAIAAAAAQGISFVSDAEELRHKESDRISVLCTELRKVGIKAQEKRDGFIIEGGNTWHGGDLEAHGDHRLAMAFTIAGLAAKQPIKVHGAEVISESYPEFIDALELLGACLVTETEQEESDHV